MPQFEQTAEDWAWEKIRDGQIANFDERCGEREPLDPKRPDHRWNDDRKLGPGFLRKIFFGKPHGSEVPIEGARIIGAWLPEGQVLHSGSVSRDVWLDRCRGEKPIDFLGATFEGWLSLRGTLVGQAANSGSLILNWCRIEKGLNLAGATIEGALDAKGLQVGQSLLMDEKANFLGFVDLEGAKVGGHLVMSSSRFEKTVNGNGLFVGQGLFMRDHATFRDDVILVSAQIGRQLNMCSSTFERGVFGDGLQVGDSLLMSDLATFEGDLSLRGAIINGQLVMNKSRFKGRVNLESLHVSRDLFMQASFEKWVYLIFARVGGNLDIAGATLVGLDLCGAQVTQELRLTRTSTWKSAAAALLLRNAQVGALQDSPEAWPPETELEGFSYSHLGGFSLDTSADARNRSVEDWKKWLETSRFYSPQPYTQLASVLAGAGRRDHANAILFAGRESERDAARKEVLSGSRAGRRGRRHRGKISASARWLWLTILCYLCGYGIGAYTFRVLLWIVLSVALATGVLWEFAPTAWAKGPAWCIGASLDQLLPLVQLNKQFSDFFASANSNLPGAVIAFFAALRVWGWILGSFLVAAVSGLTQRS